jgi:predicted ATP-grasp superfamily ATP-dependent carboligase
MPLQIPSPVLILRADHYGALGIMRSLGRLGIPAFAVHATADAPALKSRYCAGSFIWDLDASQEQDSVRFLLDLHQKIEGRPILIATNDETALFVAAHASALKEHFLFPKNSPDLVRALYDKRQMYHIARDLRIPTAETIFPRTREEVLAFVRTAQFPVMLKAGDNIAVSRRTGKKMVIARSAEELIRHYDAMEDSRNPSLMLQEYIPGRDDSVWMFNGYFDDKSSCLFGITGKKIHQTPVYTGMTALGVCLPNSIVHEQTCRLVKATGYKGILDIGFRYDHRDGSYKLLDVNPRLGATFRLFVGDDGMDVVRAQYLHLTGQTVNPSEGQPGRKWVVEDADIVSSLHYFRDRALTLSEWLSSYQGIQEGAWFSKDDWLPFLHVGTQFLWKPLRRLSPGFRRTAEITRVLQAIGVGKC